MGEILDIVTSKIPGINGRTPESKGDQAFENEMASMRKEKVKMHLTNDLLNEEKKTDLAEVQKTESSAFSSLASMSAAQIKANSDMITLLLGKVLDAQTKVPAIADDPYVGLLREQLSDLKGSNKNPFQVWAEVQGALGQFAQSMGLVKQAPAPSTPAVTDVGLTLQIKQMEIEAEERRNQWKMDFEERNRQWQAEQRRWEEEFKLRRMEILDKRDREDKRGDMFGDLLGSLSQNITIDRGVPDLGIEPAANAGPGFTCDECQRFVAVAPGSTRAICHSCGTEYNLSPAETETKTNVPTVQT